MNFLLKNNTHNLTYITFFILIWITIDTNFENFLFFFENPSYRNLVLFLRSGLVFLFFTFLIKDLIKVKSENYLFKLDKSLVYLSYIFFWIFISTNYKSFLIWK